MPLVEISLVKGELSEEQKVKIANAVSDLLIDEMPNLPKEAISVIFYENPSENWIVGGKTARELKQRRGTWSENPFQKCAALSVDHKVDWTKTQYLLACQLLTDLLGKNGKTN